MCGRLRRASYCSALRANVTVGHTAPSDRGDSEERIARRRIRTPVAATLTGFLRATLAQRSHTRRAPAKNKKARCFSHRASSLLRNLLRLACD